MPSTVKFAVMLPRGLKFAPKCIICHAIW